MENLHCLVAVRGKTVGFMSHLDDISTVYIMSFLLKATLCLFELNT